MHRLRARFHFAYVVIDFVCLAVAFYIPYLWRYNPGLWRCFIAPLSWGRLELIALPEYTSVFLLWAALALFSLQRFHLFMTDRSLSALRESWQVCKALLFAAVPTAAAVFILQYKVYSRLVFAVSWIGAFILLSLWRQIKRYYIRYRIKKGLGLVRVMIVGAGQVAEVVVQEISNHPFLGFDIVGLVSQERLPGEKVFGLKVLGSYNDLEQVIQKYYLDEIFVSVNLPNFRIRLA